MACSVKTPVILLVWRVDGSMNVSKEPPFSATSAWQLEFARLIAFPAQPPISLEQHWWQNVAGEPPKDSASTREDNVRAERGSFQGVLLALTVHPNRIIWEARSRAVVDWSGNFPTLGPFREKLDWFVELLGPWLMNSCPSVLRLALSAKLLQTAASAEEAYQVLAVYLPDVKKELDSNPNDFLLQINRRKTSEVVDRLDINRMCTWSKMNIAIFVEPGKPFEWPQRCYSALELDINTAPENTDILPSASLPRLFSELASLGKGIADRGDIP
jgi:hypothetical protein